MKKLIGIACAGALAVAPAGAIAAQGNGQAHQDAVKTCKELRKAAGKKGFADMFGGKKGLGHCIKQETKENAAEQQTAEETAAKNAAKECKAERDADPAAFTETYGTGKGKNAYGKCVSQKAKADEQEQEQQDAAEDDAQVNAAQECKTERKADPDAFAAQYGTNGNKRNAFGKCVSQKAKADEQEEQQGS
jgi:hypothetical protein